MLRSSSSIARLGSGGDRSRIRVCGVTAFLPLRRPSWRKPRAHVWDSHDGDTWGTGLEDAAAYPRPEKEKMGLLCLPGRTEQLPRLKPSDSRSSLSHKFWRPDVQNKGVSRAVLPPEALGEPPSRLFQLIVAPAVVPASWCHPDLCLLFTSPPT